MSANPFLIDSGPITKSVAVTPSDSTVLDVTTKGLYVGKTGDVTVRYTDGTYGTYKNFPAGNYLFVRCDQVRATDTAATFTAGDILALY